MLDNGLNAKQQGTKCAEFQLLQKMVPRGGFEAFPKHHSMTVSSNINILAGPAYWSTIKALPATLPGPRSEVQDPSFKTLGCRTLADDKVQIYC